MAKSRARKRSPAETTAGAAKAPAAGERSEFLVSFQKREYVVGRVLGVVRLYFRATTKEIQAAARELFLAWNRELGTTSWPWWRRYDRVEWQPVDARTASGVQTYLGGAGKDSRGVRFADLGAPEADALKVAFHARLRELELVLHGRGSPIHAMKASTLQAMVPRDELVRDCETWRERVLAACDALPVQTGVVGLALSEGSLRARDKAVDKAMTELLRSSPAIDVDEDLAQLLPKGDRIRGVGWLTVLGSEAVKAIGGEAKLRRALDPMVELFPRKHALVLQAGPRPVTSADEGQLAPYREVQRVVQPLLAPVVAALTPEGKALFARLG